MEPAYRVEKVELTCLPPNSLLIAVLFDGIITQLQDIMKVVKAIGRITNLSKTTR